jgi:hypothetical protein
MSTKKQLKIFAREQKLLVISKDVKINSYLDLLSEYFKEVVYEDGVSDSISAFKKKNYDIILIYCDYVSGEILEFIDSVRTICCDKSIMVINNSHNENISKLIQKDICLVPSEDLNEDILISYLLKRTRCVAMRKNFEVAKVYKILEFGTSQNKMDNCIIDTTFSHQVLEIVSNILDEINDKKSQVNVNNIDFHSKDNPMCVQEYISSKTSCIEFDSYLAGINLLTRDYQDIIDELKKHKLNSAILLRFANLYEKFSTMFYMLEDFDKLAGVFLNLADLMYLIKAKRYSSNNDEKVTIILECIYSDITNYIDLIFIKQIAKDIYYLEDSLQSSIQQIKLNYNLIENSKNDEDDDELELF